MRAIECAAMGTGRDCGENNRISLDRTADTRWQWALANGITKKKDGGTNIVVRSRTKFVGRSGNADR